MNSKKMNKIEQTLFKFYNSDKNYLKKILTRRKKEYRLILKILKILDNKNLKILDVGCGPGVLLSILKNEGYKNIQGIDNCNLYVKIAKKNNLSVQKKNIIKINNNKFDVIILSDVIEHSIKPFEIIKKLSQSINKNGIIIIQGPNLMPILSGKKIIHFQQIPSITIKMIQYYLFKKLKPWIIKPQINKKTYKKDDADACYLINPFDMKYIFNKSNLKILFLSTFFNPMQFYSLKKKKLVLFISKLFLIKYFGGVFITIVSNNKNNSIFNSKLITKKLNKLY
jgi:2-polyprenyl-3-methyl-5-hydroxy-6-metoxy-1,4-benzoquinol methylase